MNLPIENGKYTFVQRDTGVCEFLRHGEPWMEIHEGAKAIISMACELEELRKERDYLKHQLGRHTIEAGAAEQRMAESNAVRVALGFSAGSEDVSPNDLRGAVARRDLIMKAEALEEMALMFAPESSARADCLRMRGAYLNLTKEES